MFGEWADSKIPARKYFYGHAEDDGIGPRWLLHLMMRGGGVEFVDIFLIKMDDP